jgi:hypothetical protein
MILAKRTAGLRDGEGRHHTPRRVEEDAVDRVENESDGGETEDYQLWRKRRKGGKEETHFKI